MKRVVRLMGVLAILVIAAGARADQAGAPLVYKAKAGQVARYKSAAHFDMEAHGQKMAFDQNDVEKVTFTDVAANGNITTEHVVESVELTFNGRKTTPDDKSVTTQVIRPDGTFVSFKKTGGQPDSAKVDVRLAVATTPVFTDKPVGASSRWSHEYKADSALGTPSAKADYEVLAAEKKLGVDTLKIKMDYAETEGKNPLVVHSIIWVEIASGDTIAADFDVQNLVDEERTVSFKAHQERESGGPLSGTSAPVEKTIDDMVKDYTKMPGLFTLYRKKESGHETVYAEVKESQLNQLMMMEVTASTGTANRFQVVAGDPLNDILFKLTKVDDDRIFMIAPNINYRADARKPIARAVKRSFADGILESFRIEARQKSRQSLLINITDLFRGDIAEISENFNNPLLTFFGLSGSYMMDREKTYVSAWKNFDKNLIVETNYHFVGGKSGPPSELLPDPRSIPLKVQYCVFALPDDGYRSRLADPRIGYFETSFHDMGNDRDADTAIHYICRWNLEKSDPKAALSPPKKPIVFWLDNAIPLDYRDTVREGLLMWNKAFERVGIKDAIVVRQMPDDAAWDHADMQYNTLRWVASPDSGYAVAQPRINPITGEILNANITVDCNFVRYIKLEHAERVDPAALFAEPTPASSAARLAQPYRCEYAQGMMEQGWFGQMALDMLSGTGAPVDDKEYLHEYLREVVGHEMGHILGLRHNFVASTYHDARVLADKNAVHATGCTASLMDYGPFNVFALRHKGVEFYSSTVGPYDMWAVEYGYTPIAATTPKGEVYRLNEIASRCNEPGHAYETDELADSWDPRVTRFDLGSDPLDYWNRTLDVSRFLLLHLDQRLPKRGDSYWEFTRNFIGLLNTYARAAAVTSRFIGGLNVNRNQKGDPGEKPTLVPVNGAEQARALRILTVYLFAENALAFPQKYYTQLTDNPNSPTYSGNSFPIRDQLSSIQTAALRRLFSTSVMSRISNNEYKVTGQSATLTLAELFQSVGMAVWSEVYAHKNVSPLRRQIQRAHLEILTTLYLTPAPGTPDDAKMLAWDHLRRLKAALTAARSPAYDVYTRIHMADSLARINRALSATQMIGGPQPTGPSLGLHPE